MNEKTILSKPTLYRSWMTSSKTLGKKNHRKWKPYTKSFLHYMMQDSRNPTDELHSRNTPYMSTLSLPSTKMQSNKDWKQGMGKNNQEKEEEVSTRGSTRLKCALEDHEGMKQTISYTASAMSLSTTRDAEVSHPRRALTVTHRPRGEMGNPTKRSTSFNRNFHGTLQRLQQRLERLTRTEGKHERPSLYSKRTSILPSEKSIKCLQPHKDSLSPNGDISSRERQLVSMLY